MRIHFWNLMFSLFFAFIFIVGVSWLFGTHRIFYDVSVRDILLISLATFRLIRLFTYDVITKFIRDSFVEARKGTFAFTAGELLNCPWCVGLWFSYIVLFFYFATPYAWPVILVLAVAAIASFFQIVANLIGWNAQYRKIETQALEK